jgi:4'-phosphopantetheinyl transferase
MFSPQVVQALADTPEPEQLDAFYTAWTALEAEVKAEGRGLFGPRDRSTAAVSRRLGVAHFRPVPGFIAAVARQGLPPVEQWGTHRLVD